MSNLWVPPKLSRQMQDVAAQDAAHVRLAAALRGQLEFWNRELKLIDERLEMVWFDENVDIQGVVPCRYHLLRHEPGAPVTIIPITGPEGEFIEPNSAVFDKLREGDLWNTEARRDRQKKQERLIERKRKQEEREREERQQEILERWQAATQTRVSFNRSAPWSQNMSPAARRDAASRKKAGKPEKKAA